MRIIDYYDFIIGNDTPGYLAKKEPYRYKDGDDKLASEIFKTKSKTAMKNLARTNNARAFYKAEPDLLYYIEEEQRDEFFYLMKSGLYSHKIPAKLLYMMQECFNQHGTYNMLFKFIPHQNIKEIQSMNYLADAKLTFLDVIRNFDKEFTPLSDSNRLVKNENNYDLYIEDKDRVAIIPAKLAKELQDEDLSKLKVSRNEIVLPDGRPISQMAGYLGVHTDVYDLRDLV